MVYQQLGRTPPAHRRRMLDGPGFYWFPAPRIPVRITAPRIEHQARGRLDREIEHGFPHLPSGCVIRMERVAQQRILDNVRESVRLLRPRMIGSLRDLGRYLGRAPTIEETLDYFDTSLDELLKRGSWSQLLTEAGLAEVPRDPDEQRLAKGVRRISHVECAKQIRQWLELLEETPNGKTGDARLTEMLHVSLWGNDGKGWTLAEATGRLQQNPSSRTDLRSVLEYRLHHAPTHHSGQVPALAGPLTIHAAYTRDEILVGLGHWSLERRPDRARVCSTSLQQRWMHSLSRCKRPRKAIRRQPCMRTT